MGLPQDLLAALREKNIKRPTPIQVQGLPVALAGRDMIGIAFTGSGKTIAFSVPLIMRALERERTRPLRSGDGPVGVVLCPSRELAKQTHEVISFFLDRSRPGYRIASPLGVVAATPRGGRADAAGRSRRRRGAVAAWSRR